MEDTQYDAAQDPQWPKKSKILIDENVNISPEPNRNSKFSNIDANTAQSKETTDLTFSQNTQQNNQQRILSNMVVLQSSGMKQAKVIIDPKEISCITEPNGTSLDSPTAPMVSLLGKGDQSAETFVDPSSTQISKLDRHFMSPESHNQKYVNNTTQYFNPRTKTDNDQQSSISFDFRSKGNYISGSKQNQYSKNSKQFQQFPVTFSSNSQVRGKTQNQKLRNRDRNLAFFAGRNRVSNDLQGTKTINVNEKDGVNQNMSTSRDHERENSPDYQRRVSPPLHTFADSRIGPLVQDSTGLNDIDSSIMNEKQFYQQYKSSKVSSRVNNLVTKLNTPPISTPFSPNSNFQFTSMAQTKASKRRYHPPISDYGQQKFENSTGTFSKASNDDPETNIQSLKSSKFHTRSRPIPMRDITQHPGVLTSSLVEYLQQNQNDFSKTPKSINQNGNFIVSYKDPLSQPKLVKNNAAIGGKKSNMSQRQEKVFIGDLISSQFRPKSQMRPKVLHQHQLKSFRDGKDELVNEASKPDLVPQNNSFQQRHSSVKPQHTEAMEVTKPTLKNAAARLKVGKILGLMGAQIKNTKKEGNQEQACPKGPKVKKRNNFETSPTIQEQQPDSQQDFLEHKGLTNVQIALRTSEMQKALQKNKIKNFFQVADFGKYLSDNNIKIGKDRIEATVTQSKSPLTQTQRRPIMNEQNLLIENGQHQVYKQSMVNKVYEKTRFKKVSDDYGHVIGQIISKATDRENLQTIINVFKAERREMPLSVSAFIGQISNGDQIQKQGSSGLTNQELVEILKEKNNMIFKNTCLRVAHLVQYNKMISKIDSYQPVELQMPKVSAIFYKIPVEKKMAPLKIVFKNLDPDPFCNGQDSCDMQLFYSFTNQYPCCDETDGKRGLIKAECDGFFDQTKVCNIGNFSDNKFSQKYCYIGIYTRRGLKDYFSFGFGGHCEKLINDSFKKIQLDEESPARDIASKDSLSDGDDDYQQPREIKMYNHKKQLEYFKIQMDEKIADLIQKQIEDELNATQTVETEPNILITKQQIQQQQIKKSSREIKKTDNSSMINSDILDDDDSESHLLNDDSMHDNQNIFSEQFQTINLKECPPPGKYDYQKRRELFNEKQVIKKEIQSVQIKQLEMEKLKLKIFLTFKHDLLKDIKNQKLDELIAVLRKRKFGRVWIKSAMAGKITAVFAKNLKLKREVKIRKFYGLICKLRIQLAWKRFQKYRFGDKTEILQRAKFEYIQPIMRFQYLVMRDRALEKSYQIIRFFLHKCMKDRQIYIKAFQFTQKLTCVQDIIKQMTSEKQDQIQKIKDALESTRKQINKAIMDNKNARKYYDWVLRELPQVNGMKLDKGQYGLKQSFMDVLARKFFNYCKALHALDHVRWQSQQLIYVQKPYNFGFVTGILKQFHKEKAAFTDAFSEKLMKYPKDIDHISHFQPPQLANQQTLVKTKTKKGKGQKAEEGKSPAVIEKKGSKKMAKANTKQKKNLQDQYEPETDMSKPCFYDRLERLLIENDVPLRTLDLKKKPVFSVENVIESAKEKDPTVMSRDLEDINEENKNEPDSLFVGENQWNLSLSRSVFKACILWYQFDQNEKAQDQY